MKRVLLFLFVLASVQPAMADFIAPPDLSPGDTFRWVFVTSTIIDATSSDIAVYNAHVNAAADAVTEPVVGVAGKSSFGDIEWKAIASTPYVDARDNSPGSMSSVIYRLDNAVINPTGLWDLPLAFNLYLTETGTLYGGPVWTGTMELGLRITTYELGSPLAAVGSPIFQDSKWVFLGLESGIFPYENQYPLISDNHSYLPATVKSSGY